MNHQISQEQQNLITKLIKSQLPNAKLIAFGSRIRGNAKKYSDLDLCIQSDNQIAISDLEKIGEALSATDIPFKIDICDWHAIDEEFRSHITSYGIKW